MIHSLIFNNSERLFGELMKCLISVSCIYFGSKLSLFEYLKIKNNKVCDVLVLSNKYALLLPILVCAWQGFTIGSISSQSSSNFIFIVSILLTGVNIKILTTQLNFLIKCLGLQSKKNHLYFTRSRGFTRIFSEGITDSPDNIDLSHRWTDFIGLLGACVIGTWYFMTKYWVANNILAISLSIVAFKYVYGNTLLSSAILLTGFVVDDVIGVYATNTISTLVKISTAPVLIYFPRDLLSVGFLSTNLGYIGIADNIIPGIYLSLLMRFDQRSKHGNKYFFIGCIGYILGFICCTVIILIYGGMHPALLYVNPPSLVLPILYSIVSKETSLLWKYEDFPVEGTEKDD